MTRNRTTIPSDWSGVEYELMLICVPKSQQWKSILLGQFSELERGRNYNENSGNILLAMDIGRKIRESVMTCDLNLLVSELSRIATALENVDDKTPELYTLSEMLTALQGQGFAFQEIEAILNILGALPGLDLKFDPVKHVLDWIFKSQVLNNMYAQSTAQAAIAGAAVTGEVVDTADTVFDNIMDGGLGTIIEGINATGNFGSFVTDVWDLFAAGTPLNEPREVARVYNSVFVEGQSLQISNYIDVDACCTGQSGNTETTNGEEAGTIPVNMIAPDATIDDRKCRAANYIIDSIQSMIFALSINPPPNWYDVGDTEAYLRQIGTTSSVGNLLNALYGSYIDLASRIFGGSVDFSAIDTDLDGNRQAIVCAMINATSANQARTDMLGEMTVTGGELEFFATFLYNDILNLLFFGKNDSETVIADWPVTSACGGCDPCADYVVGLGVDFGDRHVQSVLNTDNYSQYLTFYVNHEAGVGRCGDFVHLVSAVVNNVPTGRTLQWRARRDGSVVYENFSNVPPPSSITWNSLEINTYGYGGSPPPFDIQFEWEE